MAFAGAGEAGAVVVAAAQAGTVPVAARPGQVVHIRFERATDERIVATFGDLRSSIKAHPGSTPVVLHIPAGAGRTQEMRLGVGIAYDSEQGRAIAGALTNTVSTP